MIFYKNIIVKMNILFVGVKTVEMQNLRDEIHFNIKTV